VTPAVNTLPSYFYSLPMNAPVMDAPTSMVDRNAKQTSQYVAPVIIDEDDYVGDDQFETPHNDMLLSDSTVKPVSFIHPAVPSITTLKTSSGDSLIRHSGRSLVVERAPGTLALLRGEILLTASETNESGCRKGHHLCYSRHNHTCQSPEGRRSRYARSMTAVRICSLQRRRRRTECFSRTRGDTRK